MQSITKLQERQSGRISSIFYQYKTNDQVDNHWPCTITISGGVPLSSITVAPPLQKPCISSSSSKPASFQMVLHLPMNPSFVKGSQWSVVTKEKNGAFSGTLTLTQRWWWMAGRGFLISLDAVSVMRAPSLWVFFLPRYPKIEPFKASGEFVPLQVSIASSMVLQIEGTTSNKFDRSNPFNNNSIHSTVQEEQKQPLCVATPVTFWALLNIIQKERG